MNIEEICWHFEIVQKEKVLNHIKNNGYKKVGCFDCNGYNQDCEYYTPLIIKYKENDKV